MLSILEKFEKMQEIWQIWGEILKFTKIYSCNVIENLSCGNISSQKLISLRCTTLEYMIKICLTISDRNRLQETSHPILSFSTFLCWCYEDSGLKTFFIIFKEKNTMFWYCNQSQMLHWREAKNRKLEK